MPILDEIQQFFARQSAWQRKAYAALKSGRPLDDQLFDELTTNCIHDANKQPNKDEIAVPDSPASSTEKPQSAVSLVSIENVRHVDNLAPGQSLVFGGAGLTIVYGDNGAGKTGYGRILRQVCRARGEAPALRSNVFSEPESDCSAEVKFQCDGQQHLTTVSQGIATDGPLRNFCIFDTGAAVSLVNDENATAFRPFGLDLLDRFTSVADEVRRRIQLELSRTATPFVQPEEFDETTKAGNIVRDLQSFSEPAAIGPKLAPLTTAKEARRVELATVLAQAKANDPTKVALSISAKASRYQLLNKRLSSIEDALKADSIASFVSLKNECASVHNAAEVARKAAFSNEKLHGIGEATWRHLWEAAKEYSRLGIKGHSLENAKADDLCVVCAQPLSEEAASRIRTLESFVKGELEEKAKALNKRLYQALESFNSQPLQQAGDDVLFQELGSDDQNLADQLREFLRTASDLVRNLQLHYADGNEIRPEASLEVPAALPALISALRKRSLEVQKAATATALAQQGSELAELEGQAKLAAHATSIKKEIERLQRRKQLDVAKRATSTRAISDLSRELTVKYVSDALCDRFRTELSRLGLGYLRGELSAAGAHKGKLFHRIKLRAKQDAPLREVVSEGEFRCLALAAFLAEIGDTTSGILFDDPVSSLDHTWRGRIATRLAEEAKIRQVIAFTHDIAFHFLLREAAESPAIKVALCERCVERRGMAGAGFCRDEPPWAGMKTKSRIGILKNALAGLAKQSEEGDANYERDIRDWYGRLRETWERAVEECLFKDSVRRFSHSVKTNSLKEALSKIKPAEDWAAINKGMTRASAAIRGHDGAPEMNPPIPSPSEVEQDLIDLENWVKTKN